MWDEQRKSKKWIEPKEFHRPKATRLAAMNQRYKIWAALRAEGVTGPKGPLTGWAKFTAE